VKQVAIIAGGMGRRLRERLGDLPKPMIPIGGKPLLEHQIELARKYGFTGIQIFSCYRADLIERYFGDGRKRSVEISYAVEKEPLGTAGAVLAGFDGLAENFLVIYGDTMVNVDLNRFWQTHLASGADATLLLHPNDHPFDSDLVEADSDGWITAFHNRPHPADRWFQNLVNAGLYAIRKASLRAWASNRGPMDFGKDLFPAMLAAGAKLRAYNSPEYIKDIGTPERYDKICAEFAAGNVDRSELNTPQRAIFLDRDGTLIKDVGGLTSPEQLELLPGAAAAVREINYHGFRAVLITNQPVVAKGFCTEADVAIIHRKLETVLGREHAFLDRIYYCPHHPEKGFAGERPELKIECDCRKPKPGMITLAAKDLNLDLKASWLIGDTTTDLETAKNAGMKSALVHTGYAGKDGKFLAQPTVQTDTMLDAVRLILAKTLS
jgi:histidinol-phosphate phosphatase family protein